MEGKVEEEVEEKWARFPSVILMPCQRYPITGESLWRLSGERREGRKAGGTGRGGKP